MTKARPAALTADRKQRLLTVRWQDGHESHYSFDGLRIICPCVECRGGHANMGRPPDPKMVRDAPITELSLERVEPVGNYAVNLHWSDGHATGIYSWGLLRQACPCPICLPTNDV